MQTIHQNTQCSIVPISIISEVRENSLSILAGLDQHTLDQRRKAGRWSPGEVFDHLIRFDHFLLESIAELFALLRKGEPTRVEYSLSELDVGPACIPKPLLPFLSVPFSVASSITPKPIQDLVARQLPIRHPEFATPIRFRLKNELESDLGNSLGEYQRLLGSRSLSVNFSEMKIIHPLLGTRSLMNIPDFIATHEKRHMEKMLGLLNESRSSFG